MASTQGGFLDQNDTELPLPPQITESVSVLKFAPQQNPAYGNFPTMLACALWDGTVIVYQIQLPQMGD